MHAEYASNLSEIISEIESRLGTIDIRFTWREVSRVRDRRYSRRVSSYDRIVAFFIETEEGISHREERNEGRLGQLDVTVRSIGTIDIDDRQVDRSVSTFPTFILDE